MNHIEWAQLLATVGAGLITFFIGLGVSRSKMSDLERRVLELEREVHRQLEIIHSLRDVYVSYQHFNEIMHSIKETHRELKDDMKKVLDLLSSRVL